MRYLSLLCRTQTVLGSSQSPFSGYFSGPGSDWLQAGRSWDRIPVEARFSAPLQTGLGDHPTSSTMGTGSFPGGKVRSGLAADHSPSSSAAVKKV